jgi:hypothetical protein
MQQASTSFAVGLERGLIADKEHAMMFVQGRLKASEFTLESQRKLAESREERLVEELTKLRAAVKSGRGGRVLAEYFQNIRKKRDEQTKILIAERQHLLTNGSNPLRHCGWTQAERFAVYCRTDADWWVKAHYIDSDQL